MTIYCPHCDEELDTIRVRRLINAEEQWAIDANDDGTYTMYLTETDAENGDEGATLTCYNCDGDLHDLTHTADGDEILPARYRDEEDEPLHTRA